MSPAWILLLVAGLLEVAWAVALKLSDGFRKPLATVVFALAMAASVAFLAFALRRLPVGTAYAVWTGIGAAGTAAVGMIALGEDRSFGRIACLGLIVAGIVGLKLLTPATAGPAAG